MITLPIQMCPATPSRPCTAAIAPSSLLAVSHAGTNGDVAGVTPTRWFAGIWSVFLGTGTANKRIEPGFGDGGLT